MDIVQEQREKLENDWENLTMLSPEQLLKLPAEKLELVVGVLLYKLVQMKDILDEVEQELDALKADLGQ